MIKKWKSSNKIKRRTKKNKPKAVNKATVSVRKRRFKKKKFFKKNTTKLAKLKHFILYGLQLFILIMLFKVILDISKIKQIHYYLADQDIKLSNHHAVENMNQLIGQSIFTVTLLKKNLLSQIFIYQNRYLQIKKVVKIWPSQLNIYLRNIKLSYTLKFNNQSYLVSTEAKLYQQLNKQTNLIKVDANDYFQDTKLQDQVPDLLHQYLIDLIEILDQENIEVNQIKIAQDQSVKISLSEHGFDQDQAIIMVTDLQDSPSFQIKRLQLILANRSVFSNRDININELDLRFEMPVLR